jgi:hypothetical protein
MQIEITSIVGDEVWYVSNISSKVIQATIETIMVWVDKNGMKITYSFVNNGDCSDSVYLTYDEANKCRVERIQIMRSWLK